MQCFGFAGKHLFGNAKVTLVELRVGRELCHFQSYSPRHDLKKAMLVNNRGTPRLCRFQTSPRGCLSSGMNNESSGISAHSISASGPYHQKREVGLYGTVPFLLALFVSTVHTRELNLVTNTDDDSRCNNQKDLARLVWRMHASSFLSLSLLVDSLSAIVHYSVRIVRSIVQVRTDTTAMSAVAELRQNDPAMKAIHIRLHFETSDAALARALEQNPFVTEIRLNMGDTEEQQQRPGWNSLVRVIATRANLEKVILVDSTAPAGLVRAFLQAIQQNTSIRSVDLQWVRLPIDISTFVDTASSIASFSIYGCDMEAAEQEQGARDLAAALQRNTNIGTLELSRLEDIYAVRILEGLQSNTFLKTFIFSPTSPTTNMISDATSHALQHLLESTTSIQRFEICERNFQRRAAVSPHCSRHHKQ